MKKLMQTKLSSTEIEATANAVVDLCRERGHDPAVTVFILEMVARDIRKVFGIGQMLSTIEPEKKDS